MPSEENVIFDMKLADKQYGVCFYPKDDMVFSANKIYKILTVFDSPSINSGDGFVAWNKIKLNYSKFENNIIYAYVKTFETNQEQASALWQGPFLKEEYDISDLKNKLLQVRIVMSVDHLNIVSPVLNSINISCFKLGEEETFFTKTFDLGFKPQHIILTYNGEIPESTLIQFAVAGKETANKNDFTMIKVNSIEEIGKIPQMGDKLKIMLSGIGNRNVPFIVDEFALIISGEKQVKLI